MAASSRNLSIGLIAVCLLSAGCVGLPGSSGNPYFESGAKNDALAPAVTHLLVTWRNEVLFPPDVVHQGRPLPGLAGRMFLFSGDNGFPVKGDGEVHVELYDLSGVPPGEQPLAPGPKAEESRKLIERWRFDPESLKRIYQKDLIGWGYTLFLPWGSYRPDIRQVALVVCYQPKNGMPIYGPTSIVTLSVDSAPTVQKQQVVPGAPGTTRPTGVLGEPMPAADQGQRAPQTASPVTSTRIPLPTSRTNSFGKLVPAAPQ